MIPARGAPGLHVRCANPVEYLPLTPVTSLKPESEPDRKSDSRSKEAGLLAVAKIMFFGLLMVGKKATWEKDGVGAQLTPGQIVAGAIIGGLVVVALLVSVARIVVGFAAGQ